MAGQGIIQAVFEIGNRFWVHQSLHPTFDELAKNKNKPSLRSLYCPFFSKGRMLQIC